MANDYTFENPIEPPTLSMAPVPQSDDDWLTSAVGHSVDPATNPENTFQDQADKLSRLTSANARVSELDAVNQGKLNALYDAASNRNSAIKSATGEQIDNPYLAPPMTGQELSDPTASAIDKQVLQRYADENPDSYQPGQILDAQAQERIKQLRLNAYQRQLDQLEAKYPDKADMIGANKPLEADAAALTQSSLAELQAARAAAGTGVAPFVAEMAGGLWGSRRDPLQAGALVASMFYGGPELAAIKAVRYGGTILARMIGDGFLNAGIAALNQPGAQQWRAERGQESGVVPAIQDVGMNFLFGAALGGAVGGAHAVLSHGATPAQVELVNRAMSGDMDAAKEVAAVLPKEHAPDLHAFLEADEHDVAATSGPRPEQTDPAELERAYQQAIRRAEDPAYPLPEMPSVVDRRRTDTAARDAIDKSPDDPLGALQGDPTLIESALASDDAGLRKVGRVASMGDEAVAMVRNGQVDPVLAAEVASRVTAPDEQVTILRDLIAQKPQTADRAAQIVSEAMDRRALPEALGTLLGADSKAGPDLEQVATARLRQAHPDIATEAFGNEVQREPAQDGSNIVAKESAERAGPGATAADAGAGPELRRSGETSGDAGGGATARRADTTYFEPESPGRRADAADDRAPALLDTVPIEDADGNIKMVSREELRTSEPRESFLADIIEACKL